VLAQPVYQGKQALMMYPPPDAASVYFQNRTGWRHYEFGLWVLYIAPFLVFFMGWYALCSIAEIRPD